MKSDTFIEMNEYKKPKKEEIKSKLTQEQFEVTQLCGTEPPFQNAYWNLKEDGIYVDVVSGEPLFSSINKFDSGTGWPSFTMPIEKENITYHRENDLWQRIEVRSLSADSHLGHVFDDGPKESGGMRFCINSAALRFIPVAELKAQGYTAYLKLFENKIPKT
jgi:methionine-R-sulfoxide reductase